jgi:hypothetical protein
VRALGEKYPSPLEPQIIPVAPPPKLVPAKLADPFEQMVIGLAGTVMLGVAFTVLTIPAGVEEQPFT